MREAYAAARAFLGIRPGIRAMPDIIYAFCHRPKLLKSTFEAYFYSGRCGVLPRADRELVAILVSRGNSCFY